MKLSVQPYSIANNNNFNRSQKNSTQQFTGVTASGFSDWFAKNYYAKFYYSDFARKFMDMIGKSKLKANIQTHMYIMGSTLISGMYVIRTLQNENLKKDRRRTLAINDALTWGVSTLGAYVVDSKLGNWWNNVTTRYLAIQLEKHPELKCTDVLGEWDAKNIYEMMDKAPEIIKKKLASPDCSQAIKDKYKDIESMGKIKSALDFNLDVIKNKQLTTQIKGMGLLKSLFIAGMIYRYIVPVFVMKPANKIGAMINAKKAHKDDNKQVNKNA